MSAAWFWPSAVSGGVFQQMPWGFGPLDLRGLLSRAITLPKGICDLIFGFIATYELAGDWVRMKPSVDSMGVGATRSAAATRVQHDVSLTAKAGIAVTV